MCDYKPLMAGDTEVHLLPDSVFLVGVFRPHRKRDRISVHPSTRAEANRMSIALRLAAKHLERIGKGLD